jgi:hypothetical protein
MTGADVPNPLGHARPELAGLAPLARRLAALDPGGVLRVRLTSRAAAAYARLPFEVLVGRTVRVSWNGPPLDFAVRARELTSWIDGQAVGPPARCDAEWRGALPPSSGWHRVERVPDAVVRDVVRKGAATFRAAAGHERVLGGRRVQPPSEVADALLDSVVLTATHGGLRAEVTLRTMSSLTRMGFLPRDSHVAIDVCGRWSRVAAEYGSVYAERPGMALGVVS